jgi:hypothetical protein
LRAIGLGSVKPEKRQYAFLVNNVREIKGVSIIRISVLPPFATITMSSVENHPSAGFGFSLLTLLKSAAGDKVDQDNAQHNGNKSKSHNIKDSQQSIEDDKTSTFTVDMLSSLPDEENHDEMNKIADRSSYVAAKASRNGKEEQKSGVINQDGVFGHDIDEKGQPLTPNDQLKIFLHLFGPSELNHLLESEEKFVSMHASLRNNKVTDGENTRLRQ